MILIYNFLLYCYFLAVLPYYVVKIFTSEKYRVGLMSRLGLIPRLTSHKKILIHTVSVGEFLGSVSFIYSLKNTFPEYEIIVSTTTLTSNRIAKKKIGDIFKVLYFPLDFSWAVRRFLERVSPDFVVLIETELWPNFLWAAYKKNIPTVVVNGRISEHSFRNYSIWKSFFRCMCKGIKMWGAQFDRDKNRLVHLGIPSENIFVTGSMKFDSAVESAKDAKKIFEVKPGTLVLAGGSTHSGEEEILLDIYRDIKNSFKNLVLVLAPRHIERVEELEALCDRYGLQSIKRSGLLQDTDIHNYDVVLVDTMGELISIYNLADVVFIGKSFINGGGQNLLEPAGLGKAVVCGPFMGNFLDITLWLVENKGIIQVKDEKELKEAIIDLLKNPKERVELGNRARNLVFQAAGAVDRNIELVKKVLKN